jgi:hypothetical protein
MRHSVPVASTVSCQELSDSGYFVTVLKKREEATERKTDRKFTPFKFLLRQTSSSNDYWAVVLIIFMNYCPWFGSENGCFACCRIVLRQRQNELPLEPPHVGWHSVTVVCRLRHGAYGDSPSAGHGTRGLFPCRAVHLHQRLELYNLQMEALRYFETMILLYQTIRCHIAFPCLEEHL